MSDYGLPPQQPKPQAWPQQPPQHTQGPPPGGYYPPRGRPPRRRRTGLWVTLSIVGALFVIIVIAAAAAAGKHGNGGTGGGPPAGHQTVTYVVTGSHADVQYGPAGSELAGHVPMDITRPLGSPQYYSVTAQLSGGGAVTCKILVNGKVIAQSRATGSYNIAQCEIDNFGGTWQDSNG